MWLEELNKEFKCIKEDNYKKTNNVFIQSFWGIYVFVIGIIFILKEAWAYNLIQYNDVIKYNNLPIDNEFYNSMVLSSFLDNGMPAISFFVFISTLYLFYWIVNRRFLKMFNSFNFIFFFILHFILAKIITNLIRDNVLIFEYAYINYSEVFSIPLILFSVTFIFLFIRFIRFNMRNKNKNYIDYYNEAFPKYEHIFNKYLNSKDKILKLKEHKSKNKDYELLYQHFIETKKYYKKENIDEIIQNKYCKNEEILYND